MARTTAERIIKLEEIRNSYEDRLAEMAARPKVTYDVDGQKFDFNGYQKMLMDAIKALDDQIAVLEEKGGSGEMVVTQIFAGT